VRVGTADGSGVSSDGEGELYLRGPQRLVGYVDSALDLEAFDEEGWFRTGDLGTVDEDGNIRITGRLKDVIIRTPRTYPPSRWRTCCACTRRWPT